MAVLEVEVVFVVNLDDYQRFAPHARRAGVSLEDWLRLALTAFRPPAEVTRQWIDAAVVSAVAREEPPSSV